MGKILAFRRGELGKNETFEGHKKGLLEDLPERTRAQLYQLAERRGMAVEELAHDLAMTGVANIVRGK